MNNPFVVSCFQTTHTQLSKAVLQLVENISSTDNCISLLFFGNSYHESYEADLKEITEIVQQYLGFLPPIGFVPQQLCGANSYGLEVVKCNPLINNQNVEFKSFNAINYACLSLEWGETFWIQQVKVNDSNTKFKNQNDIVFERIEELFKHEDIEPRNIVRQWNYIGNITCIEDGDQHYQLFNNARSQFYEKNNFESDFPAATGISMDISSVIIGLVAIKPTQSALIKTINNSLQIPAHKYSQSVLIEGKNSVLTKTPKFERAKWLSSTEIGVVFISGTAAIHDEKSSDKNDAAFQTKETIETINYLIAKENLGKNDLRLKDKLKLSSIRVYVKNCSDYESVKSVVDKMLPSIESIYLIAEICRKELLVEIEGIAEIC